MYPLLTEKAQGFVYDIDWHGFNDQRFITELRSELSVFYDSEEQITFLQSVTSEIENLLTSHENKCTSTPEMCAYSKGCRSGVYLIKNQIKYILSHQVDISQWTDRSLNSSEIKLLNQKMDKVLFLLNKMGLGQEAIYEEVERLLTKTDKVGLKDFKMLLISSIWGYAQTELLKEPAIKDIFNF